MSSTEFYAMRERALRAEAVLDQVRALRDEWEASDDEQARRVFAPQLAFLAAVGVPEPAGEQR